MDAFLLSTLAVAIAEIGDKTQLLAIVLAARFKRPLPIIAGILVATLANHALAATAGYFVAGILESAWFTYLLGAGFIVMGAWTLIPDKEDEAGEKPSRFGVFLTTTIAFFLVEMGDKTQVATVALAAQFRDIGLVAGGTTLGMMLANVPAVLMGEAATKIMPLKVIRMIAAALFVVLGVWVIVQQALGA